MRCALIVELSSLLLRGDRVPLGILQSAHGVSGGSRRRAVDGERANFGRRPSKPQGERELAPRAAVQQLACQRDTFARREAAARGHAVVRGALTGLAQPESPQALGDSLGRALEQFGEHARVVPGVKSKLLVLGAHPALRRLIGAAGPQRCQPEPAGAGSKRLGSAREHLRGALELHAAPGEDSQCVFLAPRPLPRVGREAELGGASGYGRRGAPLELGSDLLAPQSAFVSVTYSGVFVGAPAPPAGGLMQPQLLGSQPDRPGRTSELAGKSPDISSARPASADRIVIGGRVSARRSGGAEQRAAPAADLLGVPPEPAGQRRRRQPGRRDRAQQLILRR